MIAMVILMASSLAGCMGGCDRTLKPYSVSGRVVDPDGIGIRGVTLSYAGKVTGTTTTDGEGRWTISGLSGSVAIALSHPGWYFIPESHAVSSSQSGLLSTAIPILTPELKAQFNATRTAVNGIISSLFDARNISGSLEQIAQRALDIQGVEWVHNDSDSLVIEHVNGGIELWCTGPDTDPPPWAAPGSVWDDALNSAIGFTANQPMPGNARAAVVYTIDADPGNDGKDEPISLIENLLQNAGYEVDAVRDSDAGVGLFQRLSNYGVVYLQTHGCSTIARDGSPTFYFQTGDAVSDLAEDFYEEWQRKWIAIGNTPWGEGDKETRAKNARPFWFISDKFVRDWMGSFPDTVFITSACKVLANEVMADALMQKGVRAIAGWTHTNRQGVWSAACLMGRMKSGMSLQTAFDDLPFGVRHEKDENGIDSFLQLRFREPGGDMFLVAEPVEEGPIVTIAKPLDGQVFDSLTILVEGSVCPLQVDTNAILSVNNEIPSNLTLREYLVPPHRHTFEQQINLLPGDNTIQVSAYNSTGADSKTIHVRAEVPEQDLWTRLVWNTNRTDIDFHLYPEDSGVFSYDDCYYWWPSQPWGAHLDIDDVDGFGPEHISGNTISPGTYILAVHYYWPHGVTDPTTAHVSVRTPSGQKSYSRGGFTRADQIWTVCRITFPGGHVEDLDEFAESLPHDIGARAEDRAKPGTR